MEKIKACFSKKSQREGEIRYTLKTVFEGSSELREMFKERDLKKINRKSSQTWARHLLFVCAILRSTLFRLSRFMQIRGKSDDAGRLDY